MRSFSKTLSPASFLLWAKTASLGLYDLARHNAVHEGLLFLKTWREHPAKVGAILPSGPALCDAITREVDAARGPILELGCGTGVFTQKIIERGVAPRDLVLVELDPCFASHLRAKFPHSQVLCADACRLGQEPVVTNMSPGAAICGLPLRNMSLRQQCRIVLGVFGALRENGALYLFSYGWRCPVPLRLLDRLGLRAQKLDTVLLNVPPARVWKIVRSGNRLQNLTRIRC
jgi:phospholipid N-methyltransferase